MQPQCVNFRNHNMLPITMYSKVNSHLIIQEMSHFEMSVMDLIRLYHKNVSQMLMKAEETVKQTPLQINLYQKICSIHRTGKESRNVG